MRTALISAAALALPSGALAKPFDPRVVPPGAFWVVHVDVEATLASTLGRFALEQGGDHLQHEFAKLKAELGIDPTRDIKGVTVYGVSEHDDDGVAVITTTAAADRALAMAIARGEHESHIIEGATLHRFDDDAGFVVLPGAHPEERIVIAGEDNERVAAALRHLKAPGQGIDLAKSAITRGPGENSFVFFHASKIAKGLDVEPLSVVMQRMEGVRVDVGERQGRIVAEVDVLSATNEDAQNISQMVQGLLAMARFAGGQDPQTAPFVDLLNGFTQTIDGRTISLRLSVDPARLIQLAKTVGALDLGIDHDDDHADEPGAKGHHKHTVRIGAREKVKVKTPSQDSRSPKPKQPY